MAGRPAYPTLNTTPSALAGKRVIGVPSPADGSQRPIPSMPDSANSKKRTKTPGSRGHSPPEKRIRSGEQDRVDAARKNSDHANSRPTSRHGAPPAPSMRPFRQLDGCASGTINSLLAIKARKQAQALANGTLIQSPQSTVSNPSHLDTSWVQSIAQMKAEAITSQQERRIMLKRIEELESSSKNERSELLTLLEDLKSSKKEQDVMQSRIAELTAELAACKQESLRKANAEQINVLAQQVQSLASQVDPEQVSLLSQQVQKLQSKTSQLDEVKNAAETMSNKVEMLSRKVDILTTKLGTLESRQEQTVTYSALKSELSSLKVSRQPPAGPSADFSKLIAFQKKMEAEKYSDKLHNMSKDINNLQDDVQWVRDEIKEVKAREAETHTKTKSLNQESDRLWDRIADIEKDIAMVDTKGERALESLDAKLEKGIDVVRKSGTLNNHDPDKIDNLIAGLESTRLNTNNNRDRIDELAKALDAHKAAASSMVKVVQESAQENLHEKATELGLQISLQASRQNERLTKLEQNLETYADAQESHLDNLKAQLESMVGSMNRKTTAGHDDQLQATATQVIQPSLAQLQEKVAAMFDELANVIENAEAITSDQQTDRAQVDGLAATIEGLRVDIPQVCEKLVGGIKVDLESQIGAINGKLATMQSEQQSRANASESTLSIADRQVIETITGTHAELRTWCQQTDNALKGHQASLQELERMVQSMPQTGGYLEGKMDILQNAIISLEDRYQNITSDAVYQKMVHWIAQMYPAAPDFLNQLREMQRDTASLKEFIQKLSWLGSNSQAIIDLVQMADRLKEMQRDTESLKESAQRLSWLEPNSQALIDLVQMADDLKKMPQLVQDAIRHAKEATDKVEQNMHSVNTAKGPQKQSESSLVTVLSTISKHESLISKIETSISTERHNRSQLNKTLRSLLDEEKEIRSTEDAAIRDGYSKIVKDVRRLTESVSNLKKPIKLLDALSITDLQDICGVYPQIVRFLYQLRQVVEDINMNLPGGGLSFKFDDISTSSGAGTVTNRNTNT